MPRRKKEIRIWRRGVSELGPVPTDLVGQRGDDDAEVGQGAVDGRHLLEALALRLTLQHSLAAGQVHQAQSG